MVLSGRHAVPCFSSLVVSLPRRGPGFDPRQIWGDKVALEQVFLQARRFPLSVSFRFLPHLHAALIRRTSGRSLRTITQNGAVSVIGKHWISRYCAFAGPGVTGVNVQRSGYLFPTFRRNVRGR